MTTSLMDRDASPLAAEPERESVLRDYRIAFRAGRRASSAGAR